MTSAEGRTTRYQVVPQSIGGRLRTNIHPDGTETTTLFGTGGDVITIAPDGTESYRKRGPDPRFGMGAPVPENVTVTTPAGLEQVTTTSRSAELADEADPLSHTALGQTVTINGRTTTAEYDTASRTWLSATPEGRQSTTVLNEKGRPVSQQSGGLAPLGFGYDTRGRLVASTAGTGAEQRSVDYSYGSDGFLESITDTLQRTTSFDYDLAGRVTRQTYHDGRSVGYQYDPAGNLTAITPPGREAHIFNYTDVNLEEDYTPPDLDGAETVTSYQYNKDKQLTLVQRPDGRSIAYGYDSGGRLANRTIARGSYGYAYGANTGQLSTITAPGGGTLSYTYDGFLPLSETWGGSITGSVSWSYDNNFWLTEQCVNTDNCVSFGYDQDGLLTQAGAFSQTRHAQSGLLTNAELGNTTSEYGYNDFGELLTADSEVSGSVLASFGYQRDSLGRIGSKAETLNGGTVIESYEYDTVGRLKSVTRDGVTTSWQYDSNGNRTHENGQQIAAYDEQDRLLIYKEASYSYTANGELKSKAESGAVTSYGYDEFGNLISASLPGDLQIEYLIDGRDRRIGKKVSGQLVQGFLYGDQLNPVAELDGSGNVTARFVYGEKANVPVYMIKGGATYRIISDHLGSPRLVVNASTGEVAQRMSYDAWGNIITDTNPGFQPFGFAGGIYDQHTQLTRFGARDYDAETGRWTTKDPIRFFGGINLFAYSFSDSVNFIDVDGLEGRQ
ncbi:RHS repeat-associated core domain-containing protein [Microbulbifer taiwanensis]|uniref:RHS repeat-associated core domain-containing protein n=1 Tax=Microbulbifer taiwanensis TaxID=986746 RepID=UPI00361749A1